MIEADGELESALSELATRAPGGERTPLGGEGLRPPAEWRRMDERLDPRGSDADEGSSREAFAGGSAAIDERAEP